MKKLIAGILFLTSFAAFAQSETLVPSHGKDTLAFVPKGWKIIARATGDINKDGVDDAVLVIEDTKKENFIENESLGERVLNTNPRYLLILFKDSKGYSLATINKNFIPPANDEDSSCLADPLLQDGGISIKKGVLLIDFHYWLSCGSYGVSHDCFKLRWQDGRFVLIGYDGSEYSRSLGDESSVSINFVTKKKEVITGGNLFNEDQNKPKRVWKTIKIDKFITLQDLNRSTVIDF
ncbi:hypothetical protein R1T16_04010 [Flavobacterium sp. DG1-102-2]|uniref:hypothetical protein n=1 Tax=Flavobacterium sp. DG1-102-2 TaxID=3081663 RepID=UPI0029496AA9|nr:hypothetical protein [Flavobacterium sp. DG1-102-2]MDV6167576.1 hypothetical protein [Flavobacterium sp. DG1-102-2]